MAVGVGGGGGVEFDFGDVDGDGGAGGRVDEVDVAFDLCAGGRSRWRSKSAI